MTWMDELRFGVAEILAAGIPVPWRGKLNFLGSAFTVTDNATLGTTDVSVNAAVIFAPGTSPGEPLVWTGSAWAPLASVAAGMGVSLGARPLRDMATLRGNASNIGTGAGSVALPLDVADTTPALLAGPLCGLLTTTNRVQVTIGLEVLAEETGTGESVRDTFEVLVDVVGAAVAANRTTRVSEGGDSSGAPAVGTVTLALVGPATDWGYDIAVNAETDVWSLTLDQDAVTGRTARVRTYYQRAEVV